MMTKITQRGYEQKCDTEVVSFGTHTRVQDKIKGNKLRKLKT